MPFPFDFTGHTFWLCGLSGAGKSTLSAILVNALRREGIPVLALDGDSLRQGVNCNLGFSAADRLENIRRAAGIARLGIESKLCTVASFITPLEAHRQLAMETVGSDRFSLIFVDASITVCRQRDPKGLYAQAADGKVTMFTGMTDPFEPPQKADLVLDTGNESPAESGQKLLEFARVALKAGKF